MNTKIVQLYLDAAVTAASIASNKATLHLLNAQSALSRAQGNAEVLSAGIELEHAQKNAKARRADVKAAYDELDIVQNLLR